MRRAAVDGHLQGGHALVGGPEGRIGATCIERSDWVALCFGHCEYGEAELVPKFAGSRIGQGKRRARDQGIWWRYEIAGGIRGGFGTDRAVCRDADEQECRGGCAQ